MYTVTAQLLFTEPHDRERKTADEKRLNLLDGGQSQYICHLRDGLS